jgi:hypothetical protein
MALVLSSTSPSLAELLQLDDGLLLRVHGKADGVAERMVFTGTPVARAR